MAHQKFCFKTATILSLCLWLTNWHCDRFFFLRPSVFPRHCHSTVTSRSLKYRLEDGQQAHWRHNLTQSQLNKKLDFSVVNSERFSVFFNPSSAVKDSGCKEPQILVLDRFAFISLVVRDSRVHPLKLLSDRFRVLPSQAPYRTRSKIKFSLLT